MAARSPRRPRVATLLVLGASLLLAAGMLSACGQEGDADDVPLSERSVNDVPLDPPTLQFRVSTAGQVGASPELVAEAGEAVALVLENDSDAAYELRLLGPSGEEVFTERVPAGARGGGRARPREVGTHVVEIYPVDDPGAAQELTVEVSDT